MKKAKDGTNRGNPDIYLYSNQDTRRANAARTKLADDHIRPICEQILLAFKAGVSLRKIASFLSDRDILTRRGKEHTATSVSRMIKRCRELMP